MWNLMNSGQRGPLMGPYAGQKRELSIHHVPSVPIIPGKAFTNPNFVNKHHPSVHSYQNNFILTPLQKISYVDSSSANKALVNSSQSIVDAIKQNHLDVTNVEENSQVETTKALEMCYSRKRNKRNRKNRCGKNSKQNNCLRQINDMMEVDLELETPLVASDINTSPEATSNTFNLTDFIVERAPKHKKNDKSMCGSDEEDVTATVITFKPSSMCVRERQLSITESEDSFIVFDSGTEEELAFSDESDEETDSEDEEDELDSSSSVVPHKKVRFADDDDLCEVHPMIQWSYAYQQARKGPWEEYARDRDRFNNRISDTERILRPIFDPKHRDSVYQERFKNNISCM